MSYCDFAPPPFSRAASADVRGPGSIVRQRDPGFRDPHSAPRDLCSPRDVGEGWPAASSSVLQSDSLPPPAAAHLQPHSPGQPSSRGRSRTSTRAAEASQSWQGSPGVFPMGAASSLESWIQSCSPCTALGLLPAAELEGGR